MMDAMDTDTKIRPEQSKTDHGDRVFHYVRKSTIAESAVMGNMVVALCGETFPVTQTPKPGSPVCEQCKEIYASLPPGKD